MDCVEEEEVDEAQAEELEEPSYDPINVSELAETDPHTVNLSAECPHTVNLSAECLIATPKLGLNDSKEEKKKQYLQRYRKQWEELDFCRGWLQSHPGGSRLLAFCKVCDRTLHARKNDLRKHAGCERHKKNSLYYERGTPVRRGNVKNKCKFHPSLFDQPDLAGWLAEMPGNSTRAWCRLCACGLTAQLKALKVHGQSRKHQANVERPPQSPPPPGTQLQLMDVSAAGDCGGLSCFDSPAAADERPGSPLLESDFSGRVTYSIGLGNRKVGFLGAGQISQAIAQGMLEQGLLLPHDVIVSAPSLRSMAQWKRWKCKTTHDNDDVMQEADIVFLAVKASVLVRLVDRLTPVADGKTRLFISVVPGVSRDRVTELLASRVLPAEDTKEPQYEVTGPPLHVIRCAPNKMMSISAGFCAYCMGEDVPHALYLVVETMFSALGTCIQVEENLMDAYSTMIGSGAAFTCAFIEAMVQAGVSLDVDWDDALKVAAAVVSGTSKLLMRTSTDPSALRKSISTPGGSTIAGLAALQRGGLDEAVGKAMSIACSKTTEIGRNVCGPDSTL